MQNKLLFRLISITVVLIICQTIQAQIPRTLSYQGVLTDSLGNPKTDGIYTFTFRLYDVSAGGSAIWTEIKDVLVKRGLFSTILGDQTSFEPNLKFDRQYWLGIKLGAEPELPQRIAFTSVGYSLNSCKSDTAEFAKSTTPQLFVDSARIAGTIPNNSITNAKLSDNSITAEKIAPNQVVKTLNTLSDNITLTTIGGATILTSGDSIIINAGSGGVSGIQTVQNTNNTLDITDPNGPTATINVKNSGITATQIANNAIITTKIGNDAVTTAKILDGTILRANVLSTFKAPYADTSDFAKVASGGWNTIGNTGTTAGTNFIGTTDAQAFDIRTNNLLRTRITTKGQIETYNTGQSVFVGEGAGASDDLTTNKNVFVGHQSGYSNTTGYDNTANGYISLYSNTTGFYNTASGSPALYYNTTGNYNTANGSFALYSITTQNDNTAVGYNAGSYYTFSQNTFVGNYASPNASGYTNCMGLGYGARPTGSNRVHIGNTSITWIGGQVSWSTYSDA